MESFADKLKAHNATEYPLYQPKKEQHRFYKSNVHLAPKLACLDEQERQQFSYTRTNEDSTPWHTNRVGQRENFGCIHWAGTKDTPVFRFRVNEAPLTLRTATTHNRAYGTKLVGNFGGPPRAASEPSIAASIAPSEPPAGSARPAGSVGRAASSVGDAREAREAMLREAAAGTGQKAPPLAPRSASSSAGSGRVFVPPTMMEMCPAGIESLEGALIGWGFRAPTRGIQANDQAGRQSLEAAQRAGKSFTRQGIPGWQSGVRTDPQGCREVKEVPSPRSRILANMAAVSSRGLNKLGTTPAPW